DFNSLHIAFEHVWTELFDQEILGLGKKLFHKYVELKQFIGSDAGDPTISTLSDLKRLMNEIRTLSQTAEDNTPNTVPPVSGTPSGDNSSGAGLPFPPIPEAVLLNAILQGISKAFTVPKITWDDFGKPLPGGHGNVTVSLSENDAGVPPGNVSLELETEES